MRNSIIKYYFLAFTCLYIFSCNKHDVDSKEKNEVIKDLNIDTLEKLFNALITDTIRRESLLKKSFKLSNEDEFLFAFSADSIATLNADGALNILNPFTKYVYKTINLDEYGYNYVEKAGNGYLADYTLLMGNNNFKTRIHISGSSELSSIGDLWDSNNSKVYEVNFGKKSFNINLNDNWYWANNLFLINDTLYNLDSTKRMRFIYNDQIVYQILDSNSSRNFILSDSLRLKENNVVNIYSMPKGNEISFYTSHLQRTVLYKYNILTRKTNRYILDCKSNSFFLTKKGFFVLLNEDNTRGDNSNLIYSFVNY